MAIPIGRVLQQAGLVSPEQIKAARSDQEQSWRPLGEILAERGFIQKKTVDFFVNDWPTIQRGLKRPQLEQCLLAAGLITQDQLEVSFQEKEQSGLGIESIFILKGWVNETTINFFREHLAAAPLVAETVSDVPLREEITQLHHQGVTTLDSLSNQQAVAQQSSGSPGDEASLLKILKSDVADVPKMIRSLLTTDEDPPKEKKR